MAKSKQNPVPSINPPSSGMKAWLSQQSTPVNPPVGSEPNPESVSDTANDSVLAVPVVTETTKTSEGAEPVPASLVQASSVEESIKGDEVVNQELQSSEGVKASVAATRKPKSKVGEATRSGSYPETFFKKQEKTDGSSAIKEVVRVSEESHWLLSLIVSEARRQGHKLNMGDLIDNLLEHHREMYKQEVDELINQWKARKRIG